MSLEQDIANVVSAAEQLTGIVDTKIEDINSTVNNKVTEMNTRVAQKESELDSTVAHHVGRIDAALDNLGIIGNGGVGTRAIGVANYFTPGNGPATIHFKLPLNVKQHNEMFHIRVIGHAYHQAEAVDATFVGYSFPDVQGVYLPQATGTHLPTIYVGTDDHIYCRLTFTKCHFLTLSVDTMRVGNGRLLKHGDIEIINDPQQQI
ncbi:MULTISPECIES: hypothetical protein [Pseudoalteromonas]|uniref:Uncharacterized protein n=1 Tax=Pseudoalteromonas luteoviolacea (strain 2ta16) TaxID=1353533 RepID=V4I0B2_PSEL2|nr:MULTISPECIES: hypothetical protein [Pseudoalteromonas]ESP95483.1 hypothetical protein PL2TA16_02226 [Pseudoalteromonas luteoviolacea 2ta16]KZN31125.1 hypothetical protein N483_04705 [Pseudoalteromonas luteoviolacea NCIMB 1944]MCG7548458.1 hypothetical protein [Pseudoalteromonas sp. Of7M-16]